MPLSHPALGLLFPAAGSALHRAPILWACKFMKQGYCSDNSRLTFRNLRLAFVPLPGLSQHPRMKVEQHRQRRAAFFSKIDEQAEGDARAVLKMGTSDPAKLAVAMLDYDPKQLLSLLSEGEFGAGSEIVRGMLILVASFPIVVRIGKS